MQHEASPPPGENAPSPLEHSAVLLALWPSLRTDDRRALRLCCSTMRDAADATAGRVELKKGVSSPALCPATCVRLHSVHTLVLRSMACLRRMLLVAPAHGPGGAVFPRLQCLRLRLVGFALLPYSRGKRAMHARLVCQATARRI
jgi:hypothetical protein